MGSPAFLFDDQRIPVVDNNVQHFVVAHTERVSASTFNQIIVSSYHLLSGVIATSEGHEYLTNLDDVYAEPSIASKYSTGGVGPRFSVGWNASISHGLDIWGGAYDALTGGPISSYCSGDGTGTACPCGNLGTDRHGCGNSANAMGAALSRTGNAYLGGDTLSLIAALMPASAPCLFFQGTTSTGGGLVFGDGLLCAGGTITRLGVKVASGGVANYPGSGDPSVSTMGGVPAIGAVRFYQAYFRDAASFCTSSTFNTTNGVRATWLP
jgi:hypothetical protein